MEWEKIDEIEYSHIEDILWSNCRESYSPMGEIWKLIKPGKNKQNEFFSYASKQGGLLAIQLGKLKILYDTLIGMGNSNDLYINEYGDDGAIKWIDELKQTICREQIRLMDLIWDCEEQYFKARDSKKIDTVSYKQNGNI